MQGAVRKVMKATSPAMERVTYTGTVCMWTLLQTQREEEHGSRKQTYRVYAHDISCELRLLVLAMENTKDISTPIPNYWPMSKRLNETYATYNNSVNSCKLAVSYNHWTCSVYVQQRQGHDGTATANLVPD